MADKDYSAMTNDELIAEANKRLAMGDFWESITKSQIKKYPEVLRASIIRNLEMLDRHCL